MRFYIGLSIGHVATYIKTPEKAKTILLADGGQNPLQILRLPKAKLSFLCCVLQLLQDLETKSRSIILF